MMNLIILLLNPIHNTYVENQRSPINKFVMYFCHSYPVYKNGIHKHRKLCDIDHKNINYIFIREGKIVIVYDALLLTYITMFQNVKIIKGELYFDDIDHKNIIEICDERRNNKSMLTNRTCNDDVVNINDYKIVEIIYNNTKYYDVLVTLPTKKSLCECHNYDGIIYSIIMLKHHQIIGDIVNIIIKLIGLNNIAQTYCDKHVENKKAICIKFSPDHVEDTAFKHVFENVIQEFIDSKKIESLIC